MVYRGIVNGGVVIFEGGSSCPDGTRVEVVIAPRGNGRRRQPRIPGFGLKRGAKGRSPTATARALRRKLMRRGGGR